MLSTKYRFHRRNDVNRVYQKGKSVRGGKVSLKYLISPKTETFKVAIVVSKKISKKAIVRNRIRRRLFEVIRLNCEQLPSGFEGVFGVYSVGIEKVQPKELELEVKRLLSKIIK